MQTYGEIFAECKDATIIYQTLSFSSHDERFYVKFVEGIEHSTHGTDALPLDHFGS